MASSALSPFCRLLAPEGAFCKPEEDPFLLLESSLRCIERILKGSAGRPLRRSWIEHPYGEEEITLLEEVLPAIQQWLALIDELDQERLVLCQLEADRDELAALRLPPPNRSL